MPREAENEPKKIPRLTGCSCLLLILFLIGAAAIIAVMIWFGVSKAAAKTGPSEMGNKTITKPPSVSDRGPTEDVTGTVTKPPSVDNRDPLLRKMEEMQKYIGDNPRMRREMFSNWDGTTVVQNVLVVAPTNLNEIQRCVRAVAKVGLKLRCVGSSHSYADLFADEGQVVMETRYLTTRHDGPPIEMHKPIWVNDLTVVTAAAGLVQEDLVQFFIHNGVQMKATSHEVGALLGGLFSTGSRGEDIRNGPVSEKVVAIRFVDASGELRSLNIMQHPHEMAALKLCLGMCGVIYDLSLRVTPLEVARSTNTFPSQKDVVFNTTQLKEITGKNSLQMYWSPLSSLTDAQWSEYDVTGKIPRAYNPINDLTWLRQIEAPIYGVKPDSRFIIGNEIPQVVPGPEAEENFPNGTVGLPRKTDNSSTAWPQTTAAPAAEPTTESQMGDNGDEEESTEDSSGTAGFTLRYHQFALAYTMANTPAEYYSYLPEAVVLTNGSALDVIYAVQWDFPDDEDFGVTVDVLNLTLHRLAEYAYRGQMPVLTLIYKWHHKSPDCLLCPGHLTKNDSHIDHIFSLELVGPPGDPLYPQFVKEMTTEWRRLWPNSTPNWAKWYRYMPGMVEHFQSSFGASMDTFVDILNDLQVDPEHMFTNKILEDIFYGQS